MTGQTGMMGLEEMDLDCGNFFDQMDDLLDFPNDDVEAGLPPIDRDSFPPIWSSQSESLPSSDSVFSADPASDLSAQLSVPYEDIVQLEWLSNFVDDSFASESLTVDKQNALQNPSPSRPQFQASSPISVLESSSSCSDEKTAPRSPESSTIAPARCGRARSKRRRPANFDPRPAMRLISPASSATETPRPVNSDGHVESRPVIKIVKKINPEAKKKKISFTMPVAPVGDAKQQVGPAPTQAVRKCLHCEITKTPQWRAGPMGPKTLCNACGVRYKSGRLYPEYRPAASPTFVASLHSNSHKKVLEMRSKAGEIPAPTNSTESVSNTAAARMDYI